MTCKLNKKQLEELKRCFDLFDEDQSGTICLSELKKILDALGFRVNDNELVGLMNWMDLDGSGQIDFKEFSNVMADLYSQKPNKRELNEAFKYFDLGEMHN
jgi:Ca2+-binding EF-hand superfamily protein